MAPEITSSYVLKTEADTQRLAQTLAAQRENHPQVLTLQGPLGAGKTTFMRFYLRALGWTGSVISPTYGLIQVYDLKNFSLWHVDCYRLSGPEDAHDLGLIDAMNQHSCCIEWPERIAALLPTSYHALTFQVNQNERIVTHRVINSSF